MGATSTAGSPPLRSALRSRDGLAPPWLLVAFLLAALVLFSRSPSLLLHWQFYAEDGKTWFQQAYNLGWLHSLTIPDAGYLNSLQRLLTGPALLVPFRFVPLLQAVEGLILQALPVVVLLSGRCRNWASLPARCLWAALYLGMPCSTEVHIVLTDSQWHFALLEVLLAFAEPPRTRAGALGDAIVFTVGGFCGPFCLMLLPLTLIFWWLRRQRWTLWIAGMMAIGSAVQVWELAHGISVRSGDLGATFGRLVRVLGGELFLDGLLGQHPFALRGSFALNLAAAAVFCLVLVYVLVRATPPLRMLIVFSALIVAGALHAPMIQGDAPQWQLLLEVTTSRYWFFPILTLLWCLAWIAVDGVGTPAGVWASRLAALLVLVSVFGIVHDWRIPPLPEAQFAASAARFDAAPPGTHVIIPEYPQGWKMDLLKH